MPNNVAFLFAAFVVIWLLIAGYLFFIGGRIGQLRQEIEALRDELAEPVPAGREAGSLPLDEGQEPRVEVRRE